MTKHPLDLFDPHSKRQEDWLEAMAKLFGKGTGTKPPKEIELETSYLTVFDVGDHGYDYDGGVSSGIAVLRDLADKEHHGKPCCGDKVNVPTGLWLPLGYQIDASMRTDASHHLVEDYIYSLAFFVEGASREDFVGDRKLAAYLQWVKEEFGVGCSVEMLEHWHGMKGAGMRVKFPAGTIQKVSSFFWYHPPKEGREHRVFLRYETEKGLEATKELDIEAERLQIEAPAAKVWVDDSSFAAGSEDNVVHIAVHPKLAYAQAIDAAGYRMKGDHHPLPASVYLQHMTVTVRGVHLEDVNIDLMRDALRKYAVFSMREEKGVVYINVDFIVSRDEDVLHHLDDFRFKTHAPRDGKVEVHVDYEVGEVEQQAPDAEPVFDRQSTHGAPGGLDIALAPPHCFRSEVFLEGEGTTALAAGEDNWIHVGLSRCAGADSAAQVFGVTIILSDVMKKDVDISAMHERYPDTEITVHKTGKGEVVIEATGRDGAALTEEVIHDFAVKVHTRDRDIGMSVEYKAQVGETGESGGAASTDSDSSTFHVPVGPGSGDVAKMAPDAEEQELAAAEEAFETAKAKMAASSISKAQYYALNDRLRALNEKIVLEDEEWYRSWRQHKVDKKKKMRNGKSL